MPVGDRDQLAAHLLLAGAQLRARRMSYSFRMPLNERAVRMPLPVIEGNWGETQRRSSRFTCGEITWKS